MIYTLVVVGDLMDNKFNLNAYIKNNINEIKESKKNSIDFYYDDEAVTSVYKLAYNIAKKINISYENREDFVQECVFKFFNDIVYKWDSNKDISIVTYACVSFYNLYRLFRKNRQLQFEEGLVSLDGNLNDGYEDDDFWSYMDTIESDELSLLDKFVADEEKQFFTDKIKNDEFLYKHYVENKSLVEIAKEYGYGRANASRIRATKLEKIRKEYELSKKDTYIGSKRK